MTKFFHVISTSNDRCANQKRKALKKERKKKLKEAKKSIPGLSNRRHRKTLQVKKIKEDSLEQQIDTVSFVLEKMDALRKGLKSLSSDNVSIDELNDIASVVIDDLFNYVNFLKALNLNIPKHLFEQKIDINISDLDWVDELTEKK